MKQRCFIGLGSNMGDGPVIIRQALELLDENDDIKVQRVSSLYQTAAWGRTDQSDFTNAVAELVTGLPAVELLAKLLQVETRLGRTRETGRWGPRLIDLDLLTYGDESIDLPDLVVPHPYMHKRAFVLVPLLELEPGFKIPGLGRALEWLSKLENQEIPQLQ
ncbi:MAG TPA: 2-amino-4-hydroxy-6-hydroxymethyldihydropteridine diphosphokinase [Xanthomonadales bacterium]|nr:2-amino-4-hydroxy-6-hydroxymethyldihydropteridine diphosphokinase [Xanthomonadales bacterium]